MESTAVFAGTIPENYERFLGPFLFEPYALDLVSRLQDKKYNDILELACGTGRVTAHLRRAVKHDMLTATDLNPDMIAIAKKIVKDDDIQWMPADGMNLPFHDESFDLVVMQFGLMFFPDKKKGLQEAFRVLRPGGKLIFNTWDKIEHCPAMHEGRMIIDSYFENNPPPFYNVPFSMCNEKELKSITEEAGFKDVSVICVRKEGISKSKDLAVGMVEGNPIFISITEKDPALLEPIKLHVQKEVGKKFGVDPLKSELNAWVTVGIKK